MGSLGPFGLLEQFVDRRVDRFVARATNSLVPDNSLEIQ
jgi:hypothetical protein